MEPSLIHGVPPPAHICDLSPVPCLLKGDFGPVSHFGRASCGSLLHMWHCGSDLGMQWCFYYGAAGMLWTGETPEAKAVEENMATYFNKLQGLLLLSHGSMVGAGPTLASAIHSSIKQVVECSFKLMMETVSSFGNTSFSLSQTNAHKNASTKQTHHAKECMCNPISGVLF